MNYGKIFSNWKVRLVLVLIVLSLFVIAFRGLNFGIEFKGGVRIPVTIVSDNQISAQTMDDTIAIIKQRINKYGLSQSVIRPLGSNEIIVEVPKADASVIKSIEKILKEQGRFEALIDGKIALTGADMMPDSVGGPTGERITPVGGSYRWELDFVATKEGSERFAKAALGKTEYPVYMFLDRPRNAALIMSRDYLKNASSSLTSQSAVEKAMMSALSGEEGNILLLYSEDFEKDYEKTVSELENSNATEVITEKGAKENGNTGKALKELGFLSGNGSRKIIEREKTEMQPVVYRSQTGETIVSKWPAIGLLSAPTLSAGLATGTVTQFYAVSGSAEGKTTEESRKNAINEIKELKSIISGGRLPVSTIIGSTYVVAAPLGEKFLYYSAVAIVLAIVAVMSLIVIRYRRMELVMPIIVVNLTEILLTTTIIGTIGDIDLSAIAGIIAIIGTGINDQIIITDELLKAGKTEETARGTKDRLAKAFFIVFTVAGVAIAAMLPLLLTNIVEVKGFALATIIGIIIGVMITRPAYGVIVEEIFWK